MTEKTPKSSPIDKLKRVEMGAAAYLLAERRDTMGAAAALSHLNAYTGDDPLLKGYVKYLQSEIEANPRNAIGASKIFQEMYNEQKGHLNAKDLWSYYSSKIGGISDDAKDRINEILDSDKVKGRTLAQINDEKLDASVILQKSNSSEDEIKKAEEILRGYEHFDNVVSAMEEAYLSEISAESAREGRITTLERIALSSGM